MNIFSLLQLQLKSHNCLVLSNFYRDRTTLSADRYSIYLSADRYMLIEEQYVIISNTNARFFVVICFEGFVIVRSYPIIIMFLNN